MATIKLNRVTLGLIVMALGSAAINCDDDSSATGPTKSPGAFDDMSPGGGGGVGGPGDSSTIHRAFKQASMGGMSGAGGNFSIAKVSLDENDSFVAPSLAYSKVPYFAKIYDDGGNYNLTTKQFTASGTNYYHFCASVASFSQDFQLHLFVNGVRENAIAMAIHGIAQGCRTVSLNAGDYADVRVYQQSGAPISFPRNLYWDWMTVTNTIGMVSIDNTNAFTAPANIPTKVLYSVELEDPYQTFDPQTSRYTAQEDNLDAHVCASLRSPGQDFELDLFVNGGRERAFAISKHGAGQGCRTVRLRKGNTLEVQTYPGSTMAVSPSSYWNWMTIDFAPLAVSLGDIATFTVPSGWFTTVPFSSELLDVNSEFDTQTGRFTASQAGDYSFCASVTSFVEAFELDLFINGIRENAFAVSQYGAAHGCRMIRMKTADYVEVKIHQATGAPMTFPANYLWNWLTVQRR